MKISHNVFGKQQGGFSMGKPKQKKTPPGAMWEKVLLLVCILLATYAVTAYCKTQLVFSLQNINETVQNILINISYGLLFSPDYWG